MSLPVGSPLRSESCLIDDWIDGPTGCARYPSSRVSRTRDRRDLGLPLRLPRWRRSGFRDAQEVPEPTPDSGHNPECHQSVPFGYGAQYARTRVVVSRCSAYQSPQFAIIAFSFPSYCISNTFGRKVIASHLGTANVMEISRLPAVELQRPDDSETGS